MLKLIKLTGQCNNPDEPSLPFKLEVCCRPPAFMDVAFVGLFGPSEDVVVRGDSLEELKGLIELNDFRSHPRLRHGTISGPEGLIERFEPR